VLKDITIAAFLLNIRFFLCIGAELRFFFGKGARKQNNHYVDVIFRSVFAVFLKKINNPNRLPVNQSPMHQKECYFSPESTAKEH